MKKIIFLVVFACPFLTPSLVQAQKTQAPGKWYVEAGPYLGVPFGVFHLFHSLGIGADARVAKDLGNNFSAGGEFAYAYFFGKSQGGFKAPGFSQVGIYGNVQYAAEGKYLIGGDLGLGLAFAGGGSTAGFAKTGYLGYQWKQQDHLLSLAAYMNRTTIGTWNAGIKSWMRF